MWKCVFITRAWRSTWPITCGGNTIQACPSLDWKGFNQEQADRLAAPYLSVKLKQMTLENTIMLSRSKAGVRAAVSPICSTPLSTLHHCFSSCQRKISIFTKDKNLRVKHLVCCFLVETLIAFEEQTSEGNIFFTEIFKTRLQSYLN